MVSAGVVFTTTCGYTIFGLLSLLTVYPMIALELSYSTLPQQFALVLHRSKRKMTNPRHLEELVFLEND